jgi:hypothetical protein
VSCGTEHDGGRAGGLAAKVDRVSGLLVLAAALVIGWRWACSPSEASEREHALIGRRSGVMPARSLADTAATELNLADGTRRVVFVFDAGCGACDTQRDSWKQFAQTRSPTISVVGISLVPPEQDAAAYLGGDEVEEWYPEATPRLASALHVSATPTTLVVDTTGVITFARIGPMNRRDWLALRRVLK